MFDTIPDSFNWVVKIFIVFMSVLLILTGVSFYQQVQSVNSFRQYVNMQIERQGGLTPVAIDNIEQESETQYSNRFEVNSEKLGESVSYGELVEYEIDGTIKVLFFDLPDRLINWSGSAVSQTRGFTE